MAIYAIENGSIVPIDQTTYQRQDLRERDDLQALLKSNIEVISPDTMVVAEECSVWEDSRRRIDLLGIDKGANLVVIELKRTEDGGHMELQAIRYAAMISTLTFDKLVAIYEDYLRNNNIDRNATEALLDFLDWSEPDEEEFGQEVRIVLASADFSKEVTSSVVWLSDFGLDIRCVRMRPYASGEQTLLDIQSVIPIPEIADYQVRIREKRQRERASRKVARDFTRYDVEVAGKRFPEQSKRWMMFRIISEILASGRTPDQVSEAIPWRRAGLFEIHDGVLTAEQARQAIMARDTGGKLRREQRFHCEEGQIFHNNGKTYVLTNQWGHKTLDAVDALTEAFPDQDIKITPAA